MSRAHLERRLAALERQPVADPGVRRDLVVAVDEGREIALSPAMQGLFDTQAGVTP